MEQPEAEEGDLHHWLIKTLYEVMSLYLTRKDQVMSLENKTE